MGYISSRVLLCIGVFFLFLSSVANSNIHGGTEPAIHLHVNKYDSQVVGYFKDSDLDGQTIMNYHIVSYPDLGTLQNQDDGSFIYSLEKDFIDLAEDESKDIYFSYQIISTSGEASELSYAIITVGGLDVTGALTQVANQNFLNREHTMLTDPSIQTAAKVNIVSLSPEPRKIDRKILEHRTKALGKSGNGRDLEAYNKAFVEENWLMIEQSIQSTPAQQVTKEQPAAVSTIETVIVQPAVQTEEVLPEYEMELVPGIEARIQPSTIAHEVDSVMPADSTYKPEPWYVYNPQTSYSTMVQYKESQSYAPRLKERGWYLGYNFGRARATSHFCDFLDNSLGLGVDCDQKGNAHKLYGGYRFANLGDNPDFRKIYWGIEGGVFKADPFKGFRSQGVITDDVEAEMDGLFIRGVGHYFILDRLTIFAKMGVAKWDLDYKRININGGLSTITKTKEGGEDFMLCIYP